MGIIFERYKTFFTHVVFYGSHFETDDNIDLQFRHRINICTVHFYAEFDDDIILSSKLRYEFTLLNNIQTDG